MSTLPPIDSSMLPAEVRTGSKDDQSRYKAAMAFERQLVEQLTESLAESTKSQGGDDGSSAATDSYKQMLPGVMADSIMSAGGLGLARSIAENLKAAGK
jgi:Rod binding domain-containing protein